MSNTCRDDELILCRYLSGRYSDMHLDTLFFGFHPPASFKIVDAPFYLKNFLSEFKTPCSKIELVKRLRREFGLDKKTSEALVQDLLDVGIIVRNRPREKYDRQELYFELLGLNVATSTGALKGKRVGIVGVGGIGSTVAMMLSGAGIGGLTLSDGDIVEESNLTRCYLFNESDIGKKKIVAATENILKKNTNIEIRSVDTQFDSREVILTHFRDCDFIVLSADHPKQLHRWINDACVELNIPYITAGYTEVFACIGPMVIPGQTPCFECSLNVGMESAFLETEINTFFQAASYGPLNSIAAAMVSNEVIRHLVKLPTQTGGRQILVDSRNYEIHEFKIPCSTACLKCSSGKADDIKNDFDSLASLYRQERDAASLNSLLLDSLLISEVQKKSPSTVLDIGCATGKLSVSIAKLGIAVTALDSSLDMLSALNERISIEQKLNITVIADSFPSERCGENFDLILANLVLDHIDRPQEALVKCYNILKKNGTLIITIPHPFKDSGIWIKSKAGAHWDYQSFLVNDYFSEGKQTKCREDAHGNVVIRSITSNKWTLETYFRFILDSGFTIESYLEPRAQAVAGSPLNFKSNNIPYFAVFICTKFAEPGI